jgi:hypothetical protein
VDSAWEQEKPEARKYLKTAQNPHRPLHEVLARFLLTRFSDLRESLMQ